MRLRPAVLQIPAKSSVPPGLPLHNNRAFPTRSESTLPQLLIPFHFNSPRINTYKKPGGGTPLRTTKFRNSLLRTPRRPARTRTPATSMLSIAYFTVLWTPRVGGRPRRAIPGCLPTFPRIVGHSRATAPLVLRYRCTATRKVPKSPVLLFGSTPGNISAPPGV